MWYILKRGKPVKAKSTKHYHYWTRYSKYTAVKQDTINDIYISTVFLGLDHSHSRNNNIPVLWETMIFRGVHDVYQERYSSIEAAKIGHQVALNLIK